MPQVSALVSAYHAAEFITARLDNLMAQQPTPEIIVICQRGSAEHMTATEYPCRNVKIIQTEDIPSIYAAWNMGIYAATGDFLTSANTDDIFYPGALAAMVAELEKTEADICYSMLHKLRNGKVEHWDRRVGGVEVLRRWCIIGPMPVWRKSLHTRYGMFDESFSIAGDFEFWLRCVTGGAKMCYIPRPLGLYHSRPDSLEHRDPAAHKAERSRVKAMYEAERV